MPIILKGIELNMAMRVNELWVMRHRISLLLFIPGFRRWKKGRTFCKHKLPLFAAIRIYPKLLKDSLGGCGHKRAQHPPYCCDQNTKLRDNFLKSIGVFLRNLPKPRRVN